MKVLVIDVGATNIKYITVQSAGLIGDYHSVPTPASFRGLVSVLQQVIDESDTEAVVICLPGVYDHINDVVVFSPNIYLTGKNLAKELKVSQPVFFENDAKLAAIGEYYFGFDLKPRSMVMFTLGTGVGGGFIMDDKIYAGNTTSFELGHIDLIAEGRLCGCGKKGCLEKYCSVSGLTTTYQEISGSYADVRTITQLADAEDPVALKAFDSFALHLAHGMISVINLLTPEAIRIGGGLSELSRYYFPAALSYAEHYVMPAFRGMTDIKIAKHRNSAALLGGLALVKMKLDK